MARTKTVARKFYHSDSFPGKKGETHHLVLERGTDNVVVVVTRPHKQLGERLVGFRFLLAQKLGSYKEFEGRVTFGRTRTINTNDRRYKILAAMQNALKTVFYFGEAPTSAGESVDALSRKRKSLLNQFEKIKRNAVFDLTVRTPEETARIMRQAVKARTKAREELFPKKK